MAKPLYHTSLQITAGLRRRIPRGLSALTLLLLLTEFFDELHYGIEGAVLPALRDDLGLSYAQVGLLLGLTGVIGTLIEPFVMLLGDTGLRKRLIIGGGLTIAAGALLIASGPTFALLLVAFTILYPASGAFVTLSQATLMDLNPGRQPQMMARWTVAGSLGNVAGPLIVAGLFAVGQGWQSAYLVVAALAIGTTLLLAPGRFPVQASHSDHADGTAAGLARSMLAGLRIAFRTPRLMRWLILLDFSDLLLDVFLSYSALYFADVIGLNPTQIGLMLAVMMAAGLVNTLALIPLLERYPGRRVVRISALVTGFLYASFLLVPWAWAKLALAVAIRLSALGWYEVLQGEAYATLPERSGAVMAMSSIMGLLGGMLVWFVGWSAAQAGLPAAMWLLMLAPVSLLLFLPAES